VDKVDAEKKKELENLQEENAKATGFTKLLPYNKPKSLIYLALFASLIDGSIQPIFGLIFSKMIGFLSKPVDEYIGYGGVSSADL